MNDFKQLRIRAYLQTGVISDQFLPLDSVLYYHACRMKLGEEILTRSNESTIREVQGITLPIKKAGRKDETWFYSCSFAQFPEHTIEDSSFKTKRGDWLNFDSFLDDKIKKTELAKGKHKNYHIKLHYRHAQYIDWYCVAVPIKIIELLQFCTSIGKNTGDGWGSVLKWEVKEWQEDWSIRGFNGKLMRAVPMENGIPYGLRPSYWNPRHIFNCKLPI